MAAAKRGGGGGGVMTGPRGGRYIMHGGNKHYLKAGESPSAAAVRVGAGVAPSARGRVLAQKARGKFNAGQERQMKKVEASYAKDVARNKAAKGGGAAGRKEEGSYPKTKDNPDGFSPKQQKWNEKNAAAIRAKYEARGAVYGGKEPPAATKKERPKFDAMADAERHIAKLKAESAARNAAKAPAAIGGYGGPPPSGEATNKKAAQAKGGAKAAQMAGKAGPGMRNGKDHVAELAAAGVFGKPKAKAKAEGGKDPHAARWAAGKSVPTSYAMEQLAKETGAKVQHTKQTVHVSPGDHPLVKASKAMDAANKSGSKADHAAAAQELRMAHLLALQASASMRGKNKVAAKKLADRLHADHAKHAAAAK
jgi:hypothetical protein